MFFDLSLNSTIK